MIADVTVVDTDTFKVGYLRNGQPYPVTVIFNGHSEILSIEQAREGVLAYLNSGLKEEALHVLTAVNGAQDGLISSLLRTKEELEAKVAELYETIDMNLGAC